jgi:hypothetical protein
MVMNMDKKDKIPGGKADNKQPSDFDAEQLKVGTAVELEHTSDRSIAEEIAMDHLTEDKDYYKKLKAIHKEERIEVTTDGKIERDVGKEPLDKKPLKDRWKDLKKAILDNSAAFMELDDNDGKNEEQDSEAAPEAQPQDQEQEAPQEEQPAQEDAQPDAAAAQDQDPQQDPGQEAPQDPQGQEDNTEQLIQALKESGYSDLEIAHIVHGHAVAPIDHEQADSENEAQHNDRMRELEYEQTKNESGDPEDIKSHACRMADLEHEVEGYKKKMADMELEHAKRMKDLEYEKAKKDSEKEDPTEAIKQKQAELDLQVKQKQAELDLKFKEKELQIKLQLKEKQLRETAKQKAAQQQADAEKED